MGSPARAALRSALIASDTSSLTASSAGLVRYNTVYGSLATIPITMFWLYLTWVIVILGAEVTFALQNIKSQRREELSSETTQTFNELVALRIVLIHVPGQPPQQVVGCRLQRAGGFDHLTRWNMGKR